MHEQLLAMMAARRGHFLLESGHHGDLWLDLDTLFVRPGRLRPLVAALAADLSTVDVDAVCGPLVGGGLLAQLVALELDVECYPAQRSVAPRPDALYSARYQLPAAAAVAGKRTAVVDDVINAGSAVRATMADLRERGAEPVAVGALLVLGELAGELAASQGVPLFAVAGVDNTVWAPADCPACAAGTALEDLGG